MGRPQNRWLEIEWENGLLHVWFGHVGFHVGWRYFERDRVADWRARD